MVNGGKGLDLLQAGLDAHKEPADWPDDVCRDAFCGHWERMGGRYYWHRPSDHDSPQSAATAAPDSDTEAPHFDGIATEPPRAPDQQ